MTNFGVFLLIAGAFAFNFSWTVFLWSFLRGKPDMRTVALRALIFSVCALVSGYVIVRSFSPTWSDYLIPNEAPDTIRGLDSR
jgi:hypothetical protein